jgi:hypothetical protein
VTPPTREPAGSAADISADRLLFGADAVRWLDRREHELLPLLARPAMVHRTWVVLAMVLLVLAGIALIIGTVL